MVESNDPHKKRPFKVSGASVAFLGMLMVLAILGGILIKDIHKASHRLPLQTGVSGETPVAQAPASDAKAVPIAFRVDGRIDQMFFAENAPVKQGAILASLDKTPFEEALTSAKAQLAIAQAEYDKSLHEPAHNFDAIESARATVDIAQHTYEDAHAELVKRRALLVANQMDNVYADDVQNEHDAELNLAKARRELAQQEDIGGKNADIEISKATIQAAQANVAMAQTNLADTQLVAPTDGIVSSRPGIVGTTITAGTPVYTLTVPTQNP